MSDLITDPTDPLLTRGVDASPVKQASAYLVLSAEERAKGFVRPVRHAYVHAGAQPKYPLRDLTPEQHEAHRGYGYAKYEVYPEERSPVMGRYWTQAELDRKACGAETQMSDALAETYARDPKFYGSTYCCGCSMHRPVAEFLWRDGTVVGS